ncbi:MAG: nucleotide pyrophosphohydrolase [Spirochaetes bacterium]|nr:nucleotide pyrophosphohydrolase [Spirochaetota bacterium]
MNNALQIVADFNDKHGLRMDARVCLLDLISETGELAKEFLTLTGYGKAGFIKGNGWTKELGDLSYSLLSLAHETGTDLDNALQRALSKYEKRIKKGQNPGSGAPNAGGA